MIRAPKLQPGDTIGIISPSWGGAGAFPHRVAQGVRCLESLGFKARLAPHALGQHGFVSGTPEQRAQDLHTMFSAPDIRAIVAAIGGDHACHLLPFLDFGLIRNHPKILMGYSDVTVLNVAIWQTTGLVTFNGPALLTDFAEYPHIFEYTQQYVLKALCQDTPLGAIRPSDWWTEELLDWGTKKDLERPRTRQASSGWTWLKPGRAEGRLIGGCLESLQHLRGTRFWPDWEGTIFFFETSEEKPSPATVDAILMDYENMGILAQLHGLLVGRPMRYTDDERQQLRDVLLTRTKQYSFPIITDMDFGHTAPQFTLPIGCRARIDSAQQRFEILEEAVI